MSYKIINDAVHGAIRVEGPILELMETLELQRLNAIRQLGLTYLVFPGANHSRIEHSLGAYHVASRIARNLGLSDEERDRVCCAALLHDVGHGPFSHTLEPVLNEISGVDHMEFTERIILGEDDNVPGDERAEFKALKTIPEVLEGRGIGPRDVAALIRGRGKDPLGQVIHSTIDVDQLDYLLRDAHYTGVAHGAIDIDRLVETLTTHGGALAIDRKGVAALEGLLVARALMYSSVYYHKTVRIAEMMMARAVESSKRDPAEVRRMVDAELMGWLIAQGGHQRKMALKLKYRKLFKRVFELEEDGLGRGQRKALGALLKPAERRRLEGELCRAAKVPPGSVIVDLPSGELELSEPRLKRTELGIVDGGKVSSLGSLSPLGRALKARKTADWYLMVSADPACGPKVGAVVERAFRERYLG